MTAEDIALILIAQATWWISADGIRIGDEIRVTGREARRANILAQAHFVRASRTPQMELSGREIKVSWK